MKRRKQETFSSELGRREWHTSRNGNSWTKSGNIVGIVYYNDGGGGWCLSLKLEQPLEFESDAMVIADKLLTALELGGVNDLA